MIDYIVGILCVIMLILYYLLPHCIFVRLSDRFYRFHGLQDAFNDYARKLEQAETERRQAEEQRKRAVEEQLRKEQERRRAEKERQQAEENRKRGDEIFHKAISGDKTDESLVRQAADLGSRPACLYVGCQMLLAWSTDAYTKAEKEDIAQKAKSYFKTASLEEDSAEARTEARFGYLFCQVVSESGSKDKWTGVLTELRSIQKSGLLPERWQEICASAIREVVKMVDSLSGKTGSCQKDTEPVFKRCYCKFFNAGICGKLSTSYSVHHCNHVSDPGQCSTALLDHGLCFEYE